MSNNAIKYRCRGPRVSDDSPARRGCGNDITKLIEAAPDDGKVHAIECPKCGNVGSVHKVPADQVAA